MITASKDSAANDINKPLGSAKSNTNAAWDKVNDVKDNLEDAAHSAGRKVRGYLDNAGEEISQATDKVKTHIKGNPVQATVIALAAGFILGRLFRL